MESAERVRELLGKLRGAREDLEEAIQALEIEAEPAGMEPGPVDGDPFDDWIVPLRRRGASWNAIAREMNGAGVPTPRGGRWHSRTLRRLATQRGMEGLW